MLTAEYGGTGGKPIEGGLVVEEPDIEIGAGVSSKGIPIFPLEYRASLIRTQQSVAACKLTRPATKALDQAVMDSAPVSVDQIATVSLSETCVTAAQLVFLRLFLDLAFNFLRCPMACLCSHLDSSCRPAQTILSHHHQAQARLVNKVDYHGPYHNPVMGESKSLRSSGIFGMVF